VAENAAYQAEKQLAEMGDKVDSSAKEEITKAIAEVREVLTSDDVEQIKTKTDALQAAFHKVSEQIYQAAAAEQQAAQTGGDGASADGAGTEPEEEVVDAEVVDDERS
jgi:molecular chaperone DnaK